MPCNNPNLEQICSIDKFRKNCFCLFACLFVSLVKSFSISLVCLQRTVKGLFLRFLRSLLITYLITLSLGKIIVLEKRCLKSRILDTKTCANPVNRTNSQRDLYSKTSFNSQQMRQAFFLKFEADLTSIECTI